MTVTSETVRLTKCCHEQLLSVTTFLLGFFYFVRVSFLFTQKKKKELRQRLLSAAHALYVRLLVALVFLFLPGHFVEALLSLVKCLYFAIIVSSVLITGVVAAVGTYPRLVLRDSQLITDRRPISKRGTSETA